MLKVILIVALGGIAPMLDSTIVNVALPTLVHSFQTSVSEVQWVLTGYLLTLGVAIPVTGWAVDRFGSKQVWMLALLIFLVGSSLSGVAWSIDSLIAFRVLQGIGAGLLAPVLQTLLVRAAGPHRLGQAITVLTYLAVAAPIVGPVVGGLILNHLSWHWLFFVNLPICLAALFLSWRWLPASSPLPGRRLDVLGLALVSPGLVAILYGLARVAALDGFDHVTVLVPLAIGATLLTAFVFVELHSQAEPAIDLRLFHDRSFAASSCLLFLSGLSLYGAMLLLTLYYQELRGYGALMTGLLLVPQGIGSLLSRWTGKLTDRIGARPIVLAGMAVTAIGTLAFTQVGIATSEWLLAAALVVRGAGLSGANLGIVAGAYRDLHPSQVTHASSATRIMQQVGGSFGTAVLAVVLAQSLAAHAADAAGHAAAFGDAFWWSLGFAVLGFVVALFLPSRRAITFER